MTDSNPPSVLANLTAYNDSDVSDDEDSENLHKGYLVAPKEQVDRNDSSPVEIENSEEPITINNDATPVIEDENVCNLLPPEPPGKCSQELQDKIARLYEKKLKEGIDMNESIQRRKDFRNPSIYEKLISFCHINEFGSNYPTEIYDPNNFGKDFHYGELVKVHLHEFEKNKNEKSERTKVEFVSGTKKKSSSSIKVSETQSSNDITTSVTSSTNSDEQNKKRKSKWDVGAAQPVNTSSSGKSVSNQPGVVPVTTTASGTKATVISAFGTITKKTKQ